MLKSLNAVPFPPVVLIAAYLLDLWAGDPERFPHPVRWIGRLIKALEAAFGRFRATPRKEKAAGVFFAAAAVGVVYGVSYALLYFSHEYSYPVFFVLSTLMVWASLSIRSLKTEALSVADAVGSLGIDEARKRLSRIVGRDTAALTEEGVLNAAVETVSENTSDGIVAPLFYLAVGGPALMMAYKAVNTLDSMVGYKNDRYRHFGWFSARLDDALNFIPARLTAALVVCASFILGYNWRRSFAIWIRDGRKHPSPNSGAPEAAVAGALGLKLGGPMSYGGVVHQKPYMGDGGQRPGRQTVASSVSIMHASALLMIMFTLAVRVAFMFIF